MTDRLAFALNAIEAAGKLTMFYYRSDPTIHQKENLSPVTAADREAEALLRQRIEAEFPGEDIYGEELGAGRSEPDRWVIDPIDGTKSFICGVPLFANLLSYEQDGLPILAVMNFPALGEVYWAELGQGAFRNGRPIHVSQRDTIDGSTISCGSHKNMHKFGYLEPMAKHISTRTQATRTWCDAYGHALVASGFIEAMIDPIVERYDISAPFLIVREAGGVLTTLSGEARPGEDALSSNGLVHDELLGILRQP